MITNKIENYLNENDILEDDLTEDFLFDDADIMTRMFDLITKLGNIPEEHIPLEMIDEAIEIIEALSHDVEEGFTAKKVKIKPADKRKRKRLYRKAKAKIKMAGRKFRRTAAYKKWKRMKERKQKSGKTATGKRIRKFL